MLADSQGAAEPHRQIYDTWLSRVAQAPYKADLYQLLRRVASAHPALPPLGEALRPRDEPVRLAQPAEFDFAPAPLHALELRGGAPPRIVQRVFGLLGPNGALPLHLTEYTRERTSHHGDVTLQRFLDMLTHRFALLFYRAWAEAQITVNLDRADNKANFNRIGALVGVGLPTLQGRDALPDASWLHFAGRLSRQTRDAEGLLAWCRSEFDVPVSIEQWCGHWMALDRDELSRLGRRPGALLGTSTVLGSSVWDVQHKFRIVIGPLRLDRYNRFLPGGTDLARLRAIVRAWVGIEFEWDVKLILRREEVPKFELGARHIALGHAIWLGNYRRSDDAADLRIDVERTRPTKGPRA
jgi:type VI secretion system protein ImpH